MQVVKIPKYNKNPREMPKGWELWSGGYWGYYRYYFNSPTLFIFPKGNLHNYTGRNLIRLDTALYHRKPPANWYDFGFAFIPVYLKKYNFLNLYEYKLEVHTSNKLIGL